MKKVSWIYMMIGALLIFGGCDQEGKVKGIASSVNEDGDISKIKITAQDADIRSGCTNDSGVLQSASQNDTYDVVSKVSDWYAVQLPDNTIGFVPEKQAKAIVDPNQKNQPAQTGANAPQNVGKTVAGDAKDANNTDNDTDVANSSPNLSADEQQMLDLVNEARAKNNLPALKINMEVTNVARIKAQDLIDNNYFSHNSPTYGSPFDMMKKFGIQYTKAGENLAGNQTVAAAHESLMNSPGHRANILSPDYTHIGIGIKEGGQYGKMFTQMFVSQPQ